MISNSFGRLLPVFAAAIAASTVGAGPAAAATLNFVGKITSVNAALAAGFTANQSVFGTIIYNEGAIANSSMANTAFYYNSFSGSLLIGSNRYSFNPTTILYVSNDNGGQDQASLYSSTSSGPSVSGYAPGYFSINLYDTAQAVLGSTAVPTAKQLASFPIKGFTLYFGTDYSRAVTGVFNSVAAVPEPAPWAMMILGVGMAGFALRRRGRETALGRHIGWWPPQRA